MRLRSTSPASVVVSVAPVGQDDGDGERVGRVGFISTTLKCVLIGKIKGWAHTNESSDTFLLCHAECNQSILMGKVDVANAMHLVK